MQTIKEIQEEILEDFDMFEDWMQKYEYLIDLGKDLTSIEEEHKIEDNLIKVTNIGGPLNHLENTWRFSDHNNGTEIYFDIGYNNLSSFSAAFKKKYGVSPNQLAK